MLELYFFIRRKQKGSAGSAAENEPAAASRSLIARLSLPTGLPVPPVPNYFFMIIDPQTNADRHGVPSQTGFFRHQPEDSSAREIAHSSITPREGREPAAGGGAGGKGGACGTRSAVVVATLREESRAPPS